jgi:hypothetical protein
LRNIEASEFEPVTSSMRVLISDAYPPSLLGMRRVVYGQNGIEVLGQVGTARELWPITESCPPDVLLLDLQPAHTRAPQRHFPDRGTPARREGRSPLAVR